MEFAVDICKEVRRRSLAQLSLGKSVLGSDMEARLRNLWRSGLDKFESAQVAR